MARKKKKLKGKPKGKSDAKSSSGPLTAEEISEKYTVAELREILRENGLKVGGRKKELVERVLPVLNDESSEDASQDLESEKAEVIESEELIFEQTEDSSSADDADSPANEELLSSALSIFGLNYEDLPIDDEIIMGDETTLNIEGFIQDGLSMSDSTMSMVADSDSSNVDLKLNIPEVSYSDFENTIFTFKNLDLSILPSSDPQSLELSALMDSLEIITETNYVNLKGLNLLLKSYADENGVRLDIDINSFIYPDFNDTSINFEDLDLSISIGADEQKLAISANLPELTLLNKNYRVKLSDLNLNIILPDLKLSSLDLSILMSDFHYTNFDDVHIDMDNVGVSLEHIPNPNSVNAIIRMDSMDGTGLNSFDELFPMLNITDVNIKAPTTDSEAPINLTCLVSLLDITKMDLSSIASLLISGFDLDTYMSNISGQDKASLDGDAVDISGAEGSDLDSPGFDVGSIVANMDYSGLDAIVLDLTGLLDSADIDLSDFGIDLSDYDLSAISLSDLIEELSNSEFIMTAIAAISKLFSIDFDNLDTSGLIANFDAENFDISTLLASLNLEDLDIAAIMEIFNNPDIDLASVFENCDYSCLDAIKLDLTGLIDALGIDASELGLDKLDLSAISLSEIIGILSNIDFDMSTITVMLKLFGLDLDDIDLSGLISSFDAENFDISSLLASLNLDKLDIDAIVEMFDNSDIDLTGVFENCDYSCLDAIVLDLTGLIDALGIDPSELGLDKLDLSAISLSDLIDILSNPEFDISAITADLDLSDLELDDLDLSGLIVSFDTENFDISTLLASLNLEDLDIAAIIEIFNNPDIDLAGVFENCDYSCLDAIKLDLTGLIDALGIDPSELGIDLSDYDLSAINLSDLIGILTNLDFDMSTITAMLKLFGLDLDDLDLSGLISNFDAENFDISALLASLNLGDLDIAAIMEIFNNPDIDLAGVFENCDYSCLDAIKLDLTGLLDSADINLADFGIDTSDYDLSAISLSDLIDVLSKSEFIMTAIAAISKLSSIDLDNLDTSGLITSFDAENFDISGLLTSLESAGLDVSGILDNFNMNGFALPEFLNSLTSMFIEQTFPEATGA